MSQSFQQKKAYYEAYWAAEGQWEIEQTSNWCAYDMTPPIQMTLIHDESRDDAAAVASAIHQLALRKADSGLALRVAVLEKVVLELRDQAARSGSRNAITVPITSFAGEGIQAIKPIFAVVEEVEDQFEARFYDANIGASGDTESEAIGNLKSLIVSFFRRYSALGNEKLGPEPRHQLAVLSEFITLA